MFEQTTLKNEENYTIQNPERTLTTFVDSRQKIDEVIKDPKKLSDYMIKATSEWVQRMEVTLGNTSFDCPIYEEPQLYVLYFREKMADFFKEIKPFETLPRQEEVMADLSREIKPFETLPRQEEVKKEFLKKVKDDFLKLDETKREKFANFLLIALNINEPGLLYASSAFLTNGFLMTGLDYKIEGCKDLIIQMTSDQNIYFNSNGVIRDSEGKRIGEFIYNGYVNILDDNRICIQDYLKLTSYDKHLTSSLEYIIRLYKFPREKIYIILDDLISQPKKCDIKEVSILIRELIYWSYQELLKISKDCKEEVEQSQFISHLQTWLDTKDENDKQDRKNEFWWRVERRLRDFSEIQHPILTDERYIIEGNVLFGIDILNILRQAILKKVMVNIFNDYKSIFFELVTAIESKTKLEIPQNLVSKAKLSKDRILNPLWISPNDVIKYYRSKIVAFLDSCKEQLELNSNRNNGIWFFKFFNLTSPLKKYIDEKQKETANIMDFFAQKGDYHLFTTPEQNNSSQLSLK